MRLKSLVMIIISVALALLVVRHVQKSKGVPFSINATASAVQSGLWTQDYEAALTLAKEKNLPILYNFTGSDWCPWCILMEKNVFTKKKWYEWANGKVVCVFIDFPRNTSKVPRKYQTRNQKLMDSFRVKGFPTYIVTLPDGTTELGRLGASRAATPESFIQEMEATLKAKPRR